MSETIMERQSGGQPRRMPKKSLSARIEEARKSKATELDLSGEELSQLPEALGQLSQLQQLYLHSNQLTAVPEGLGQLSQLQVLRLDGNQLTAVPETFQRLTSLQDLYLHGNEALGLPLEVLGPTRQDV